MKIQILKLSLHSNYLMFSSCSYPHLIQESSTILTSRLRTALPMVFSREVHSTYRATFFFVLLILLIFSFRRPLLLEVASCIFLHPCSRSRGTAKTHLDLTSLSPESNPSPAFILLDLRRDNLSSLCLMFEPYPPPSHLTLFLTPRLGHLLRRRFPPSYYPQAYAPSPASVFDKHKYPPPPTFLGHQ